MYNESEMLAVLAGCDEAAIQNVLAAQPISDKILKIIDLYESIWGMTYGSSHDPELIKMSLGPLAARMVLLNEQEDLIPMASEVERVEALDLGGFEEAVLFPELLRYKALRRLDIWDNGWTRLPEGIYGLHWLRELRVCDSLASLSPRIAEMRSLRQLLLPDNQLMSLPDALKSLPSLEVLDLSGNYLEEVPAFLLEMPSLRRVDLSQNTKHLFDADLMAAFEARGVEILY